MNNMTQEKLFSLTRAKLIGLAQEYDVKNYKYLNKQALVEQLLTSQLSAPQPELYEQEEIEEAKYYLGPDVFQEGAEEELPFYYEDTKVVLMVRDPYWIYAYWEVGSQRFEQARMDLNDQWEGCKKILRVYDVTGRIFDGNNANSYFDLEVNEADSWYIEVNNPSRSYCACLGLRTRRGEFYSLTSSNQVVTPQDAPSAFTGEEWSSGYTAGETAAPGAHSFEWEQIYQPVGDMYSEVAGQFSQNKAGNASG